MTGVVYGFATALHTMAATTGSDSFEMNVEPDFNTHYPQHAMAELTLQTSGYRLVRPILYALIFFPYATVLLSWLRARRRARAAARRLKEWNRSGSPA
jgi:hypothetical protein